MADITRTLIVNGVSETFTCDSSTPLLWVLRDFLGHTGTKFGCGIEQCYACTVFINGVPEKSCDEDISSIPDGTRITTIEGLKNGETLHYVQQAWIDAQVPQCGWCQSGAIMRAVDLLNRIPNPSDSDIDSAMKNICACGTYPRMRAAIHTAVTLR